MDRIILRTGITVPIAPSIKASALPTIVFAHGLGMEPTERGHHNDAWVQLVTRSVEKMQWNFITYTARGHGLSTGWEDTAGNNPEQFHWKYLAADMSAVAEYYNVSRYVAGGSSMGCATSLYVALNNPTDMRGLLLVRPPAAWEARARRKNYLLAVANKLQKDVESQPGEHTSQMINAHHVIRGAAYTDLPPKNSTEYTRIGHIPTLILTIKGDHVHPVEVAEELHRLLPQSILHVMETQHDAYSKWPDIIRSFLESLS